MLKPSALSSQPAGFLPTSLSLSDCNLKQKLQLPTDAYALLPKTFPLLLIPHLILPGTLTAFCMDMQKVTWR